ncbi:hypothetical protein C7293_23480 [filamentous cyanobacterium CCT1]|nr:hypothetical protein C7293_23480 [filamentous cyanobacterium CCT1]PSN80778.1 hypothetical protein C8B47_04685 [filamentous cyanobacterium CCP4]
MSDTSTLEQRQAQAEQTVRRFVRRFEPSYHALACHAALPLVLTPELVNYLRNEFLRNEEVPWIAEVDLLLSELCQPVGYELYAMDTDVRAYLLAELERQFGRSRIQQVAKLLISYVRYLAETGASVNEKELEAQQWAAMVYLGGSHRQTAVRQIAEKFRAGGAVANQVGEGLVNPAELARLAQITTELAPELANYSDLLEYAALVSEVIVGDGVVEVEQTERSYEVLPGYELKLPEIIWGRGRKRALSARKTVSNQASIPSFSADLEFEAVQFFELDEVIFPPLQTEVVEVVTIDISTIKQGAGETSPLFDELNGVGDSTLVEASAIRNQIFFCQEAASWLNQNRNKLTDKSKARVISKIQPNNLQDRGIKKISKREITRRFGIDFEVFLTWISNYMRDGRTPNKIDKSMLSLDFNNSVYREILSEMLHRDIDPRSSGLSTGAANEIASYTNRFLIDDFLDG